MESVVVFILLVLVVFILLFYLFFYKCITDQRHCAAKKIFKIDKDENLLPISDRHLLMLEGKFVKLSSNESPSNNSENISKEVTFSNGLNKLVRLIISEFNRNKKQRGGNNILFHVVKDTQNKKLKVLVAMSGFGKAGQPQYLEDCEKYQNYVVTAVQKIRNDELSDYSIEGKFAPFSVNWRNINSNEFYAFDPIIKKLLADSNENTSMKAKAIVSFLRSNLADNVSSFYAILKSNANLPAFIETFDKFKEISDMFKSIDTTVRTDKTKIPLIEWLTEDFLKNRNHVDPPDKLDKADDFHQQSRILKIIKRSASYLKYQANRIYGSPTEPYLDIEQYRKNPEFTDFEIKYKTFLNEFLPFIEYPDANYDILRCAPYCSEDNLIHYLSYKNDILIEYGEHYIFNIDKRNVDSTKDIPIKPPCIRCISYFPLALKLMLLQKTFFMANFEKDSLLKVDSMFDAVKGRTYKDFEILQKWFPDNRQCMDILIFTLSECYLNIIQTKSMQGDKNLLKPYQSVNFTGCNDKIELLQNQLHPDIINGEYEEVEKLLDNKLSGVSSEDVICKAYKHGFSLLQYAAGYRNVEIFELLLNNIPDEKKIEALMAKPEIPSDPRHRKNHILYYWNTFFLAIYSSDLDMVKYIWNLLDNNKKKPKDLTIDDPTCSIRMNPLHLANMKGDYDIVNFLIDKGFFFENDNFLLGSAFPNPAISLNLALCNGYEDIVLLLLKKMNHDNVNVKNAYALLHWLSECELIKNKALKLELKKKSNVLNNVTQLSTACICKNVKIVEWFCHLLRMPRINEVINSVNIDGIKAKIAEILTNRMLLKGVYTYSFLSLKLPMPEICI